MTRDDEWKKLGEIREEHGPDSKKYRNAYTKFTNKYGDPDRGIEPPGKNKNTNGGSHRGGSKFFGSEDRS